MDFIHLEKRPNIELEKKLTAKYLHYEALLNELEQRQIPTELVEQINKEIQELNSFSGSNKKLLRLLRTAQSRILRLIEKELELVPRNYYRNMWLAVGMASFGIPLGAAFGGILGNMGLMGIGLPIGMVIGMAIGAEKDKKALASGNQLDIEMGY